MQMGGNVMLRIILAGLLGGLAMYVWSSIAHVATPLGEMGISTIKNEAAVTAPMQAELGETKGFYKFPAAAMAGKPASGPGGVLVYWGSQPSEMSASTLASEAVVEIAEAIVAAIILSTVALTGYLARVGVVTLVGVCAVLSTNPSYWIWYKFPTDYTLAAILIDLIGYIVAGLVIAAILRPRTAAASA
jgi:hypothetical protein